VAIVLAAGEGSRMRSARSKLLHTIGGHSLLHLVCDAVAALQPSQMIVVVGYQSELVGTHATKVAPACKLVTQNDLDGPVSAIRAGLGALSPVDERAEVVIVFGDLPLLSGPTLQAMASAHRRDSDDATVLASSGGLETADDDFQATDAGAYVFDYGSLSAGLAQAGERPIEMSALVSLTKSEGGHIGTFLTDDPWQTCGVDDRVQLARLGVEFNRRQVIRWMRAGVTVIDPDSTWIEADVDLAQDVTLWPGTMLLGATSVAQGATIGPETTIKDSEVGAGATIRRSHVELAVVGAGVSVGPYARLRPGTQIGDGGVVGTFVETKNIQLGAKARIGHLTYCGDATLGDEVDIGAGVVFANWDATNRARTEVGASAIIGAGSLIVPPAEVPEGGVVQPGSLVRGASENAKRGLLEDS